MLELRICGTVFKDPGFWWTLLCRNDMLIEMCSFESCKSRDSTEKEQLHLKNI